VFISALANQFFTMSISLGFGKDSCKRGTWRKF